MSHALIHIHSHLRPLVPYPVERYRSALLSRANRTYRLVAGRVPADGRDGAGVLPHAASNGAKVAHLGTNNETSLQDRPSLGSRYPNSSYKRETSSVRRQVKIDDGCSMDLGVAKMVRRGKVIYTFETASMAYVYALILVLGTYLGAVSSTSSHSQSWAGDWLSMGKAKTYPAHKGRPHGGEEGRVQCSTCHIDTVLSNAGANQGLRNSSACMTLHSLPRHQQPPPGIIHSPFLRSTSQTYTEYITIAARSSGCATSGTVTSGAAGDPLPSCGSPPSSCPPQVEPLRCIRRSRPGFQPDAERQTLTEHRRFRTFKPHLVLSVPDLHQYSLGIASKYHLRRTSIAAKHPPWTRPSTNTPGASPAPRSPR